MVLPPPPYQTNGCRPHSCVLLQGLSRPLPKHGIIHVEIYGAAT